MTRHSMESLPATLLCAWLAAAPAAADLDRGEARALDGLLESVDAAARESAAVLPWFLAGGRDGLHYLDYRPRAEEVAASIDSGEAPARIAPIAALVGEALRAQGAFFADWYDALQEGRAFESQLTSELGYHEQLHRSKRALLEAWGRLVLLLPEGDPRRDAFLTRLCALDLGCGRRAP